MRPTTKNPPRSRNPFWRLYEIWVMFFGLGLFALICLGSVPLFAILFVVLPKSRRQPVARYVISRGFRVYLFILHWLCTIRSYLHALDSLQSERSLIIVANHPSLLDAVMILSRFPNAVCVMKAALLQNVLFGVGARMAGYVSNENVEKMIAQSRSVLADGGHFIIFPEGVRSREFPISTFSSACNLFSKITQTPIQTVFLDFTTPYLGKYWGLFNPPVLPLLMHARLGKRFAAPANAVVARRELESYYRANTRTIWLESDS